MNYKKAIESAFTDPLTGAQNRAAMNMALTREVELAKRQGTGLSVIMFDADHFKKINDTHGHSHGDEVLKALSHIAQDTIRQSDVLYRYGGEEFLVILSQTDVAGAAHLADRMREHVAALDTINGKKSSVTISLGVTTMNEKDSCQTLFDRADKALYQAKSAGRNKTVTMIES
jgi:diguanylate cyclase (GGDEF)-like protein